MDIPSKHFLVIYRGVGAVPTQVTTYNEPEEALDAFEAAQVTHRDGPLKVTLLSARSVDDLKITHGNLFGLEAIGA